MGGVSDISRYGSKSWLILCMFSSQEFLHSSLFIIRTNSLIRLEVILSMDTIISI